MSGARIEDKTIYRAVCYRHRWYGRWARQQAVAEREQWLHDGECVPEAEGWSPEVAGLWRSIRDHIANLDGVSLAPTDLRVLSDEQRFAVLAGVQSIANQVATPEGTAP